MPNIEVTAEVATEMHRLHGRIAELERQVQEAHAELGLASQTDVQARLHARVAELEAFRLARIGEPTMADLRARLKVLERIAYDLAMLVSDHVAEDVAWRDAAMVAYVEYLSKPNKR